ncbi:MAG: hypothetical protein HUK15_06245, partial [Bacteroidales bacterium]|nr:hypothetical protein [Bacteroidales bacterium]
MPSGANDYIEVYQGENTNGTRVGRYSGASLPQTIVSTGSSLTLLVCIVSTNTSWSGTVSALCLENKGVQTVQCGNSIDIGGDYAYEYYRVTYTAPVVGDEPSTLSLSIFNLPDDGTNDYIKVFDGTSASGTPIGTYNATSTLPITHTSTSASITLEFRSNSTNHGKWEGMITASCPEDRGIVEVPCGTTKNVSFPYANDDYFKVTYKAPALGTNPKIKLTFTALPLGDNDYVKVYQGETATGSPIGTYSGTTLPSAITSTDRSLTLVVRNHKNTTTTGSWGATVQNTATNCPTTPVVTIPTSGFKEFTLTDCAE